jgi:predicted phosphohydrolase
MAVVYGHAHHCDDLLNGGRIRGIELFLVARRTVTGPSPLNEAAVRV